MLANCETGSVFFTLWKEPGQHFQVEGKHQWSPRAGQALSFRDEGVGCPQKGVHDVLLLLDFLSLVPAEHGDTVGVMEGLHAADFILNQGAERSLLLLLQQ